MTQFRTRGINGTNVLTKFHDDQTINVASRVFTRQNVDDGRRTTDKRRSQKLTMSTLCSDVPRGIGGFGVFDNLTHSFKLYLDFIEKTILTNFHEDQEESATPRV
ncbi:hypothetical protein DPMN_050033 [Dreissena polymorpha]|uniref:Uncharacterized protein n=1 Tax=Dreissena polymorpha TaxID=45954 RepID=A0A9D4CFD3_DREPO|nr:hypothetical protein DPMN_050033 [Dreissena polymorpha]